MDGIDLKKFNKYDPVVFTFRICTNVFDDSEVTSRIAWQNFIKFRNRYQFELCRQHAKIMRFCIDDIKHTLRMIDSRYDCLTYENIEFRDMEMGEDDVKRWGLIANLSEYTLKPGKILLS